ncbi:MAG: hypothetical protein H7039_16800 [Bryobacteraceae bacterium]|nr:hypothetical protein [Bryobacteraceae bacterium]
MRFLLGILGSVALCFAQVYTVDTVAGNGVAGFAGDGSAGIRAQLNTPDALVLDATGRLYVVDKTNNRIRRIDNTGRIATVATSEQPILDLAVDSSGTLYIATAASVRVVPATGPETLIASVVAPGALAVESSGTLLVADGPRILRVTSPGLESATITEVASLPASITSLAVLSASRILAIAGLTAYTVDNGSATPIAGASPVTPGARIAADRWGDIYISGARITKIIAGQEYPLIGLTEPGFSGDGGPAVSGLVNNPAGLFIDRGGNVFFADSGNHRIRFLRPASPGSISALSPPANAIEIWPRQINLRWTGFFTSSTYEVFLGTAPDSLVRVATTSQTAFRLPANLSDRTRYYWQVRTQFIPQPPVESPIFSFLTTTTEAVPPPQPASPTPANNSGGNSINPTFSWSGTRSIGYEFFLGDNASALAPGGFVTEPSINFNSPTGQGPSMLLRPETTYYWRVVAFNETGATTSPVWTFTTGPAGGYPWVVETIAGAPLPTGDGLDATSTALNFPRQPAGDLAGNTFFINGDRTIRRIGADGKLSTFFTLIAGSLSSLAADPINPQLWFATPEYASRIDTRNGQRIFVGGQAGRHGYAGDNGPAAQALFDGINSIAPDRRGALYLADTNNNRVRVIVAGQVRTFAGSGTCGETSGQGQASSLPLCAPTFVALDADSNVYVYASGMLLRITSSGSSERIAGTGTTGYTGDGGPALLAQIGPLSGLAVDRAGFVYLADAAANTIRLIDPSGIITTWAGVRDLPGGFADETGVSTARFSGTSGISLDRSQNLLIGDTRNFRIRRVEPGDFVRTIAGTDTLRGERGNANSAFLFGPTDVAVDGAGNTYVADSFNNRIRRIGLGRSIDTVAGGGTNPISGPEIIGRDARDYQLDLTSGASVAINGQGNPVFNSSSLTAAADAESASDAILGVAPNSIVTSFAVARIGRVGGIASGPLGELYLSDTTNHRLLRLDREGLLTTIAGTGISGFAGDGGVAALAQMTAPGALAISPEGDVFVAETGRIRRVSGSGRISTVAFENATGLAFDRDGVLYVSAGRSVYITVVDRRFPDVFTLVRIAGRENGIPLTTTEIAAVNARFGLVRGLAATTTGALVFADFSENAVRRLVRNLPDSVAILSGDKQTLDSEFRLAEPLRVRVVGRTGVPVAGISVRFSLSVNNGSPAQIAVLTTDANGIASVFPVLNFRAADIRIFARVFGVASSAQFTITSAPTTP